MPNPRKREKIAFITMSGVILTALLLIPLPAVQEEETYPFPEDPLSGSRLFVNKGCIKCHSIWGIGDTLGPDLAQIGKEQTLLQLAGLLWSHSPKMIEIMEERGVSRPTFTPKEMGDLMGYIYYFNYFDQPGKYVEGERLFVEKGCTYCHHVGGDRDKDSISLDDYGKYISPSFLVTGLWNHSFEILSELRRLDIPQPEFKGQELAHLLAYIRGAAINQNGKVIYAEPGSPKRGKDIFEQKKCNVCHSVSGRGGRFGPDMGGREMRLTLTEIAGKIWSHSGAMLQEMKRKGIPFPIFTPREMADLISFLYFIQFYDEEGDVKEGKKLFREKVCIFCHALEGEGEDVGPDLTESESHFSPIFLASAMWNHALIMEDMLAEKDLAWPRFSGNEMRDLVSYVRHTSEKSRIEEKGKPIIPAEPKVLLLSENRFDLELAEKGKRIYLDKACNACHNIAGNKKTLGGDLKDITKIRDLEWLFNFIKSPKEMLQTDGLAKQLLRDFNNIPMPQQGLEDEEVIAIIEYLKDPGKVK